MARWCHEQQPLTEHHHHQRDSTAVHGGLPGGLGGMYISDLGFPVWTASGKVALRNGFWMKGCEQGQVALHNTSNSQKIRH